MARQIGQSQNRPTPLLSLVWKLQQSADEVLQAKVGVGLSQIRILAVLDKSVAYSQRAVASELGQTEANVSRQLRLMKRHGLVTINKNKQDHRQRDVSLTPKGWRLYAKAEQALKHYEKGLLSTMNRSEARNFIDNMSGLYRLI
ncbi:MAG TPA: MarR family transcriptional regulator [Candidatus Saccharimonadales bacterium]|nr:MarR family transcriptional regulator [Candidatus Saccharimonadales bacterium]